MRGSGRSRGGSHGAATADGAIRSRGGIAQRMVLASVALAVVVGAVFATLLIPIQDARNAEHSALHSQDVLIAANGLEERVLDLETGQRGFILTRQPELGVGVRDDGVGGAQFGRGSGLVGIKDREEALGGRIKVDSEPGAGTSLSIDLPLTDDAGASL